MAVPGHLTISIDGLPFDSLLSDWRWLVAPMFTPVLMTAFGDLFLRDEAGSIHLLDLMSGQFTQVAPSQTEFDRLCDDREQRRSWFLGFLLTEVRKLRGDLAPRQCYSCKTPLSLGGQLDAGNFERTDLEVHYSLFGQLHRQTRDLPTGTKIQDIKIEPADQEGKRKSCWRRL
jgi:hypothetical protein